MNIKSNYHVRNFLYWDELTEQEQQWFIEWDGVTEDDCMDNSYLRYKGIVYSLTDFLLLSPYVGIDKTGYGFWDGYKSESYFLAVLIKVVDSDTYIVGTALS